MFEEELQNLQRSPLHNVERTDRFTHSDESVLMIIYDYYQIEVASIRRRTAGV